MDHPSRLVKKVIILQMFITSICCKSFLWSNYFLKKKVFLIFSCGWQANRRKNNYLWFVEYPAKCGQGLNLLLNQCWWELKTIMHTNTISTPLLKAKTCGILAVNDWNWLFMEHAMNWNGEKKLYSWSHLAIFHYHLLGLAQLDPVWFQGFSSRRNQPVPVTFLQPTLLQFQDAQAGPNRQRAVGQWLARRWSHQLLYGLKWQKPDQ